MKMQLTALAILLLAAPAVAQPFILKLEPQRQQQPSPSPSPVAPPLADASPEAGQPQDQQPAATGDTANRAGSNGAGAPQDGAAPQPTPR